MFDVSFSLHELLRATGGRLVGDNPPVKVDSVFTDTRESAKNALFASSIRAYHAAYAGSAYGPSPGVSTDSRIRPPSRSTVLRRSTTSPT